MTRQVMKPSEIEAGRYYRKANGDWPRLVIKATGRVSYIDPWGPGECYYDTSLRWCGSPPQAADESSFRDDDIKGIKEWQAKLANAAKFRLVVESDLQEMVSYRKNVTGVDHTLFISTKGNG